MDRAARRYVIESYERSLARYGPGARAVKWVSRRSQFRRFQLLAGVGPWAGVSVADVGCGLGDFFGFLRGHRVRYTGYDLSPAMVAAARKRHRARAASFEVRDILRQGLGGRFDYVTASGTFNIRVPAHDRFLRRMLKVMYAGCRRAIAFNVLHPDADRQLADLAEWAGFYTVSREQVQQWCLALSPRVGVRPHKDAYESTFYVYRDAGPAAAGRRVTMVGS